MSARSPSEKLTLKEAYQQFTGRKVLFLLLLFVAIVLLAGIAATLGSADISVTEVYSAILARFFPGHFRATGFRRPLSGGCGCTELPWPSREAWVWP